MKPANPRLESKKRKRHASPSSLESAKKGKVQAQRKFAIGSGGGGITSGVNDRKRFSDEPQANQSSPSTQGSFIINPAPTAKDLVDFLCFSRSDLLPSKLEYLKEVSYSTPVHPPSPKSAQPQPSTSSKKSDKGEVEKVKNSSGVNALRKKYQEQRLAKQKATSVTKLAKKVKGKNMMRTRSAVIQEEKLKAIAKPKAKVLVSLRSGAGRKPLLNSQVWRKNAKKSKLQRAGLRSGGKVIDPNKFAKELTKSKPIKADNIKSKIVGARKNVIHGTKEVGSDFSSDDNEPLLTNKKTRLQPGLTKILTRGRKTEVKSEIGGRPTRRTKLAAAAYVGEIARTLVSSSSTSFDEDPVSLDDTKPTKREADKPKASSTPKPLVKEKLVKKGIKSIDKETKNEDSERLTRSSKLLATRSAKKAAIRGLLQKKKLKSMRTLTRLQGQKLTAPVIAKPDKKEESTNVKDKGVSDDKSTEESPTRRLRGKEPDSVSSAKKAVKVESKKEDNVKDKKTASFKKSLKPKPPVDEILPSKRPVRKCSTIDKMWIDVDGFTSDEDDFVDVKSIATTSQEKKVATDATQPKKGRPTKVKHNEELDKKEEKGTENQQSSPKTSEILNKSNSLIPSSKKVNNSKSSESLNKNGSVPPSPKKIEPPLHLNKIDSMAQNTKKSGNNSKSAENLNKSEPSTPSTKRTGNNSKPHVNKNDSASSSNSKSQVEDKLRISEEVNKHISGALHVTKVDDTKKSKTIPKPSSNLSPVKKLNKSDRTTLSKSNLSGSNVSEEKDKIVKVSDKIEKSSVKPPKESRVTKKMEDCGSTTTSVIKAAQMGKAEDTKNKTKTPDLSNSLPPVSEAKVTPVPTTTCNVSPTSHTKQIYSDSASQSKLSKPETDSINKESHLIKDDADKPIKSKETPKTSAIDKKQTSSVTKLENSHSHSLIARLANNASMTSKPHKGEVDVKACTKDTKVSQSPLSMGAVKEEKTEVKVDAKNTILAQSSSNKDSKKFGVNEMKEEEYLKKSSSPPKSSQFVKKVEIEGGETDSKEERVSKAHVKNTPLQHSKSEKDKYSKKISNSDVGDDASPSSSSLHALPSKLKDIKLPVNDNRNKPSPFKKKYESDRDKSLKMRDMGHVKKDLGKQGKGSTFTQAVKSKRFGHSSTFKETISKFSGNSYPDAPKKRGRKPSPRAEVVRRERPKRLCSAGKSWVDRDSDDSSFFDEDDEERVLEMIRRSEQELKERESMMKEADELEERVVDKDCSGGTFSESDDEPLMKRTVDSPSCSQSSATEDKVSTKNVIGKSEVPEEGAVRMGASGLNAIPDIVPDPAITFSRAPREPINTDGLDLLSEVVAVADKSSTIQQWLKDNRKGFLGFDDSEVKSPAPPAFPDIPNPVLQFVRTSPEAPKAQLPVALDKVIKKATSTPKPEAVLKRPPVSSVHDLLKLQRERKGSPKPTNEQHSKNCKCNSCVVMKGWFKNKQVPGNPKATAKDDSPLKPFQALQQAFGDSPAKASVTVSPIVHTPDGCEAKPTAVRKMSFLDRMRERERKEASVKAKSQPFSPSNESSVYAFEPEAEKQSTPFRLTAVAAAEAAAAIGGSHTVKSTSTSISIADKSDDESLRNQSTSIAVQVNLDESTKEEEPPLLDDGKSIEISTQTEGADDDSQMFYIPLQQPNAISEQPLIQGVTVKLGTEGPCGPNQKVVMQAKLVTKPLLLPSMQAVVMPQKQLESPKNTPPVGTVQPTTRRPPGAASSPRLRDSTSPGSSKPKDTQSNFKTDARRPSSAAAVAPSPRAIKDVAKPSVSVSTDNKANDLPKGDINLQTVTEAPTFYLTEKEFQDPLEFFERIRPAAESFGICRIVPPNSFKPDCKVSDDMRFTAYNQYVHRMLHRWGPNVREKMAMKKYLQTQRISLKTPPCVGGIEVDLPGLYQAVQASGGLMKVMEKQKWQQVADMLKIPKAAHDRATKLDSIYCQYLLPYETLKPDERNKLLEEVDKDWEAREQKLTEGNEQDGEEEEDEYIEECEECIVKGRSMALSQFYRIARNTMSMWFKSAEPSPNEVEAEFWNHVTERKHHVCVHSGSIDSSGWGYGFPVGKNTFAKHPWNLKVLTNNSGSVLRSLGPVMGVTVPTLHVGMVFAAFCWYRDPHGLPWVDYLHTGAPKIWYGICDDNSSLFRDALTKLLPRHIKDQRIWLPCDTAMAPPARLAELGVPLSRTTQKPGQFVLVFPRAFTSSLCTGYLVSESVYFAQSSWLQTAEQAFSDIQDSAEPSVFSLDNLLLNIAADTRASLDVLNQVLPMVQRLKEREENGRKTLRDLGVPAELLTREAGKRKGRSVEPEPEHECEVCRASLYLSMVCNTAEESVYCLDHAISHLTAHPEQVPASKLRYTQDQEEINQLLEKLQERIDAKALKKK